MGARNRDPRRFLVPLAGAVALGFLAPLPVTAQEVDSFATSQAALTDPPGGASSVATAGSDILGQHRGLTVALRTGAGPVTAQVSGGVLTFSVANTTPASRGEAVITWDGDSNPLVLSPTGLGGVNLAAGGDAFRLTVGSASAGVELTFTVYTDAGNASVYGLILPAIASSTDIDVPFGAFVTQAGAGADFTNVGAITLVARGMGGALSLDRVQTVTSTPSIVATKTDGVTSAMPGQTLDYTVTLGNTGLGTASDVRLTDTIDAATTLVPGSVEVSPLALDDQYVGATVGNVFAVGAPGVLGNDIDGNGDPLSVSPPGPRATTQGGSATVNGDGSFSYTPPAAFRGLDSFTYQADDGHGIPGPGTVIVHVECGTIDVSPTTLPAAIKGSAYAPVTFTATGATGTTTWTFTGTLPTGMSFSTAGVLQGTPTQDGPFPLTFIATDSLGCTGSQAITLTVNSSPTITSAATTTFAPGKSGQTFTVTTTGFPTGASMVITRTGTLPSGVTFTNNNDGTATIAGTPAAGTQASSPYLWVITASNGISPDATQDPFTFNVTCPTIAVSGAIPALTFGTAMATATFTQTGGNGTIGWSATGLPTPLSIDAVSGQVTGTPNVTGTFSVAITATDAGGCTGTKNLTVTVAPVAAADSYTTLVDNTQAVVTGGLTASPSTPFVGFTGKIIANDLPTGGVTAVAGTFATSAMGSVTIATDGTFIYTPKANPSGSAITSDSFTYTVTSNTGGGAAVASSPATVSLSLANRVWYVENDLGSPGNGQSQTPFNTLAAAQAASTALDNIFVYRGTGTTSNMSAGIVLKAGQTLTGQGVALTVNGHSLVAATSNPLITNAGGAGITLADGNTIAGLTVTGPSGAGITGSGVNVLTVDSSVSVMGASGVGFQLSTSGSGPIAFAAPITNSGGRSVDIRNRTGGTVTISGAISGTGTGVFLDVNTGATFTFSGGLIVSSGPNAAFTATGGGTVNVCATNPCGGGPAVVNTLTTTSGIALNVASTTIGGSGLTFRSISSTGAASGIVLSNTGAGSLTVTGNGGSCTSPGTCTGGAIQSSSGPGMSFTSTGAVSLTNVDVESGQNDGIRGSTVGGFTLVTSRVVNNGNAVTERGIEMTNLTGTGAITSSTVTGNAEDNLWIQNSSGTLSSFNVTGSTFSNTSTSIGNDGIHFEGLGTAHMTISVTGCTFNHNRGDHFQASTDAANTGVVQNITFNNNTLTGDRGTTYGGTDLGASITINPGGAANVTYDIESNSITGAVSSAITIDSSNTSQLHGTINSNVIGVAGTIDSGSSQGDGISVFAINSSALRALITNNTIKQYSNLAGIDIRQSSGSATIQAVVTGNSISNPGTFAAEGIFVSAGTTSGDSGTMCLDLGGAGALANSIAGAGGIGASDFRVRQRFLTTVRLPGYGGGNTDTAAVVAFLQGRNSGNGVPSGQATVPVPFTGGGFVGGAACTAP